MDSRKDEENQEKHGISCAKAQFAFADPRRVIAEESISQFQREATLLLRLGGWRSLNRSGSPFAMMSFESLEPAIGGKVGNWMSEKIKYTDEPLGNLEVVPDFLPRPEDLVFRDEGVKVTIALSKRSVEFFKGQARKHQTQYQRMIRRLLDAYAEHHSRPQASRSSQKRSKLT
jgi:hypothetical protein